MRYHKITHFKVNYIISLSERVIDIIRGVIPCHKASHFMSNFMLKKNHVNFHSNLSNYSCVSFIQKYNKILFQKCSKILFQKYNKVLFQSPRQFCSKRQGKDNITNCFRHYLQSATAKKYFQACNACDTVFNCDIVILFLIVISHAMLVMLFLIVSMIDIL